MDECGSARRSCSAGRGSNQVQLVSTKSSARAAASDSSGGGGGGGERNISITVTCDCDYRMLEQADGDGATDCRPMLPRKGSGGSLLDGGRRAPAPRKHSDPGVVRVRYAAHYSLLVSYPAFFCEFLQKSITELLFSTQRNTFIE